MRGTRLFLFAGGFVAWCSPFAAQEPRRGESDYDPSAALERMAFSRDSVDRWKALSVLVAVRRSAAEFGELNAFLRRVAASELHTSMQPRIDFWIAENELLAGDTARARESFLRVGEGRRPGRRDTARFTVLARERAAELFAANQDVGRAIGLLEQLERRAPEQMTLDGRLQLMRLYARRGDRRRAQRVLSAIDAQAKGSRLRADSSLMRVLSREKALLASGRERVRRDRAALVRELQTALREKNEAGLRRLASPVAFYQGVMGSEPTETSTQAVFSALGAAIKTGTVSVPDPPVIRERKGKAYVLTTGWPSPIASSNVWFWLQETPFGWDWSGIILEQDPANRPPRVAPGASTERGSAGNALLTTMSSISDVTRHFAPQAMPATGHQLVAAAAPPDGQPLRFTLKAPWKNSRDMASGKNPKTLLGTACTEMFGFMGHYYGQGGHTGRDHFAIDFTVWETDWVLTTLIGFLGIPYVSWVPVQLPQPGMEVRAVAPGRVVERLNSNGQILVEHLGPGGLPDDYSSAYLHMDPIFVHVGDFVARGTPLGKVDDVGLSTGDHLHFTLFDKQNSDDSVMPHRLDGESRDEDGDPKCIESSNSELFTDGDSDNVPDSIDNCPWTANSDQLDQPRDGQGDACDDSDGDFVVDAHDNCRDLPNNDQFDLDGDGIGTACDTDRDGDGHVNATDNCSWDANADQADADGDRIGDICDEDIDGDGWENTWDYCPTVADPTNADADGDRICDVTDNCPAAWNPTQADANADAQGNACDTDDTDSDGVPDMSDNCPSVANPAQDNVDADRLGDACDPYRNISPVPEDVARAKRMIELQFKFEALQKGLSTPIGPICLTCPPETTLGVEILLAESSPGFVPSVIDSEGRSVAAEVSSGQVGKVIRFVARASETYDLAFSARSTADVGPLQRVKVSMRIADP
jgi:hypothetical protein